MIPSKIRVLVVDNSALMRKKITEMINQSSDCEVIATARDGYEALKIIQTLHPDVVILELELPKMDGLTCLGYIMNEWPMPVVVLSTFEQVVNLTVIDALEYGAFDFIAKPSGAISMDIDKIQEELLDKIHFAVSVPVSKLKFLSLKKAKKLKQQYQSTLNKVVVIGASTGGPRAITQILNELPGNLPAAILIIQHMPKSFITSFAQRLNQQSELVVKEAEEGDLILAGKALLAPHGFDMKVISGIRADGLAQIKLEENLTCAASPSIDATFISAARVFGRNMLGVLLTGMGKDGVKGCLKIKEQGGKTIAEHEASCIVYGMPASAIAANAIDYILPLDQIPNAIITEVGQLK